MIAQPQTARELRLAALQYLLDVTGGSVSMGFQLYDVGGAAYYSSLVGTSTAAKLLEPFDGHLALEGGVTTDDGWSVRNPLPKHRNRFVTLDDDRDLVQVRETQSWELFYGPCGIEDQLRGLFYVGEVFVGFLAALRGELHTFDEDTRRRANAAVPRLLDYLQVAWNLEAEERGEHELHVVVDERGRVVFANDSARIWLNDRRRHLLAQSLRGGPVVIDGMRPSPMRLDRGLVYMSLMSVKPIVGRSEQLSVAQRALAELAQTGLTNAEIAAAMNMNIATVKYHLGQVYRRLEVEGRRELSATLERDYPSG